MDSPIRWRSAALLKALAALMVLAVAGCSGQPRMEAAAIPPIPPDQARIWFYRQYLPNVSLQMANIALNGARAISVPPDGSVVYRDVPPGPYRISVENDAVDPGKNPVVTLAPGQEAFVEITVLTGWTSAGGGDRIGGGAFGVAVRPPDVARPALAQRRFGG